MMYARDSRKMAKGTGFLFGVLSLFSLTLVAEAAAPEVSRVTPPGGQRGTDVEVKVSGQRLADAEALLFSSPGITVKKIEPNKNGRDAKVTLSIAKDCEIGENPFRVRTKTGISSLQTFFVSTLPEVMEQEPNNNLEEAKPLAVDSVVSGTLGNEDIDYYVIEAKKGQRINVETAGLRVARSFLDLHVTLMDEGRFELATADDTALLRHDPHCGAIIPKDGKYYVAIRESAYGGGGRPYRLSVGTFPRPTAAYPSGGRPGEELTVKMLGDPAGPYDAKIKLPNVAGPDTVAIVPEKDGKPAQSPIWVRVADQQSVLEAEPNNDAKQAQKFDISSPAAVHGIISEKGDTDWFKFDAKKGQVIDFRVFGRGLRSPLDSVLDIYNAKGQRVAGNDDSGAPDSYSRYRIPADGEYMFRVRDHLMAGGADYVYRVEATPVTPTMSIVAMPIQQRRRDADRLAVPRGNRSMVLLRVARKDFGGEVKLDVGDLPKGVTAINTVISDKTDRVPLLIEASADAPLEAARIKVDAKKTDPKQPVTGHFDMPINYVLYNNNQPYYQVRSERFDIAVVDEVPYSIELEQPKAPIVQDGATNLKVKVHRKGDFKGDVRLYLPFRPPGVSGSASIVVKGNQSEVDYPLNANNKASVGTWPVVVIAESNINGTVQVASKPVNLEIAPPYVNVKLQMAAAEQGQQTDLIAKIEQKKPFEGKAKIKIIGLPHKVTAPEKEFTKDAPEDLAFPVTIDATSPVGNHKALYCEVTVTENGAPVIHRLGRGGVLRIDPPPKKKPVAQKKPEPKKQAAPVKKERQLSRLEKLRLEAKQAAQTN
ncbi:putative subtilase-type serine protease precursor [Planctomycetes bacterium Pan216]|uniref:Putative subtilase-type serine protease n=1 Tax=Kolteria novifilia TaxID=2527975 RepID=A0A518BB63_9BACT|nr:putative subtilase-type serine protease precursor [Planctomycetes bacterium Pan216]